MAHKPRIHDPSGLFRIGSAALLASSLVKWYVLPAAGTWRDLADGIFGLFIGVTIAAFLLAVRINTRRGAGSGDRPCA